MAIPVLNHMDFQKTAEIRNVLLHVTADSSVSSPGTGQIIYDSGTIKYYNGSAWVSVGTSSGTMSSFTLTGDSGSNQTIGDGNTLDVAGGTGISTVVGATDTVTVNVNGVLEDLNTLGAAASDGQFIVATGAGAFAYESGDTAIASLGITATGAELNVLDGITSTTAELNILDGVTATATEINLLDGVTATTSELNILDGVTSTATELNLLDGVTGTLVTEAGTQTLTNKTIGDDLTISSSSPVLTMTDTDTNADARISASSSAGSLEIAADFNNESNTTKIGFTTDGKEVMRLRGDNSQIGSLRLFPLRSDNTAQGIFFGTNSSEPGFLAGTFVRAISFSTGNKLHLYPSGTSASASVPLAISSDGQIEGTSIKDEDNMSSDSATHLATQQSIKAYVDTQTGQANLNTELGNITEDVTIGDATDVTVTASGDLVVTGDLTVSGTTTTVNSTTVTLDDHNIVLDSNNSGSSVVNGAGITIEGGTGDDAKFTYSTIGPKFELRLGSSYEDLQVDGIIAASLTLGGTAVTSTAAELNILDGVTATASELNILDGVTATASELNILDGVTATASELNILDGVTATTAELNYSDGVTSNIQTQLDAKKATADFVTKKLSGDGTNTTYTITHSFGTPIVMVQVLDYGNDGAAGASYDVVNVEVQRNSDNAVDLIFASAPSATQDYLVLITKFPAIS